MSRPQLLLVEDSEFLRSQLQDGLRGFNFDVSIASSVSEAKRHIAENDVDCVLTNYDLPDTTGVMLADELPDNLSVVLVTTTNLSSIASEALDAGVTEFVHKDNLVGQMELIANRVGVAIQAND